MSTITAPAPLSPAQLRETCDNLFAFGGDWARRLIIRHRERGDFTDEDLDSMTAFIDYWHPVKAA